MALIGLFAFMLLASTPALSRVVLTRGTGATQPEIDAQAEQQYENADLARQFGVIAPGFLIVTNRTPGRSRGGSPLFNFTISFEPLSGPDPVIATVNALGQSNDIFGFGIAVSAQDVIAIGASATGTNGPFHAIKYSLASNTTSDLGALGGSSARSIAYGISDDASTIVGLSDLGGVGSSGTHAIRIGADGTMTDLGSLAGANRNSVAFATNGDGSVVVGQTDVTNDQHAFRWTLTPGGDTGVMTDLGGSGSIATAVNIDGSVAVGGSLVVVPQSGGGSLAQLHAALWTKSGGPLDLGVLPGHAQSIATGVSGDGTVVVGISDPVFVNTPLGVSGYGYNTATSRAFVWTHAIGMQDLTTLVSQAGVDMTGSTLVAALSVARSGQSIVGSAVFPTTPADETTSFQLRYCNGACPDDSHPLVAAVLPSSRSVAVGGTATAFATIINPSASALSGCFVTPVTALPASFTYQTTDPQTNTITGTANTPVSITAGGSQSFVFAVTPNAAFPPTNLVLGFECTYAGAAAFQAGLDTLLLSASTTPVPDVVALGATPTSDGILHIAGTTGSGAFAVATVNLGAGAAITASADTGGASLPLSIALCQTDPASGACITPAAPTVTTTINANQTPTLASLLALAVRCRSTRRTTASLSASPTPAMPCAARPASRSRRSKRSTGWRSRHRGPAKARFSESAFLRVSARTTGYFSTYRLVHMLCTSIDRPRSRKGCRGLSGVQT